MTWKKFLVDLNELKLNLFSAKYICTLNNVTEEINYNSYYFYLPILLINKLIDFKNFSYVYKLKDNYMLKENNEELHLLPVIMEANINDINILQIINNYQTSFPFWLVLYLEKLNFNDDDILTFKIFQNAQLNSGNIKVKDLRKMRIYEIFKIKIDNKNI